MRDIDLAYLAGMVDADGYITATMSVRKGTTYFGAQVGITGSRREPHDLATSLFGGTVTAHQPELDRAHHKVQYHWQRGGRRAVPAIIAIQPFLRVKADQAVLVLQLQDRLEELRVPRDSDEFAPWMPAGWDPTPSLTADVLEIRALHARRGRTSGRQLDDVVHDGYPVVRDGN